MRAGIAQEKMRQGVALACDGLLGTILATDAAFISEFAALYTLSRSPA
jgi:hypothetical protein